MVKPWSDMIFGPLVNPFSSMLKKVVLGLVRGGVIMVKSCSIKNLVP